MFSSLMQMKSSGLPHNHEICSWHEFVSEISSPAVALVILVLIFYQICCHFHGWERGYWVYLICILFRIVFMSWSWISPLYETF
jgi:hypothetical protein